MSDTDMAAADLEPGQLAETMEGVTLDQVQTQTQTQQQRQNQNVDLQAQVQQLAARLEVAEKRTAELENQNKSLEGKCSVRPTSVKYPEPEKFNPSDSTNLENRHRYVSKYTTDLSNYFTYACNQRIDPVALFSSTSHSSVWDFVQTLQAENSARTTLSQNLLTIEEVCNRIYEQYVHGFDTKHYYKNRFLTGQVRMPITGKTVQQWTPEFKNLALRAGIAREDYCIHFVNSLYPQIREGCRKDPHTYKPWEDFERLQLFAIAEDEKYQKLKKFKPRVHVFTQGQSRQSGKKGGTAGKRQRMDSSGPSTSTQTPSTFTVAKRDKVDHHMKWRQQNGKTEAEEKAIMHSKANMSMFDFNEHLNKGLCTICHQSGHVWSKCPSKK